MQILTKNEQVKTLCSALQNSPYIALDTEFMREGTYYSHLSLIQVATDGAEAIIDPLSKGLDLSPFFAILCDPDIVKVLHSARQDLEIFYDLMGTVPAPVFDTQVAASYVGYGDQVGYENLVNRICKVRINKSARFTDWSKRPLTQNQLHYAIGDVTHLRDIYKTLKQQLIETNRIDWIADEIAVLENPNTYTIDPMQAYTRLKINRVTPKFLAVLQQVACVREKQAIKLNLPRRRYIKDETLMDIAGTMPQTPAELGRIRGIPKSWLHTYHGALMLQAVKTALHMDESDYPTPPVYTPPTKAQANMLEILRLVLKICASNADIVPRLIVSSTDLEHIVKGEKSVTDLPAWTYDIFGVHVEKILSGKMAITLNNDKICFTEV